MHEVYSVEYRLLQHAPFPAVVQDAAAVYAHVVEQYGIKKAKCKVVLIGDSSGGNLVLALARWLRDEGHMPLPDGLLLLSVCIISDMSLQQLITSHSPHRTPHTNSLKPSRLTSHDQTSTPTIWSTIQSHAPSFNARS